LAVAAFLPPRSPHRPFTAVPNEPFFAAKKPAPAESGGAGLTNYVSIACRCFFAAKKPAPAESGGAK